MTMVDGLLQKRILCTKYAKKITGATYPAVDLKCKTMVRSPGYPR